MLPSRVRSFIVIAALLAGPPLALGRVDELPTDAARESALLAAAGAGFNLKRTPHFLIAYNTDRAIVDDFALRIESTYRAVYRFCESGKIPAKTPQHRLEIAFFDRPAQYDAYGSRVSFPAEGTYGFYYLPTNRSAFYNVLNDPEMIKVREQIEAARSKLDEMSDLLRKVKDSSAELRVQFKDGTTQTLTRAEAQRELTAAQSRLKTLDTVRENYSERINTTIVQHEVAHQVFFNAGVHPRTGVTPKWIVEGLACMFETPRDSNGAGLATTNQLRLHDFREAIGVKGHRRLTAADFVQAVHDGKFHELPDLVSDSRVFEERGRRGAMDYAATWALTHYLQRTRMADLSAYVKDLAARPAEVRATCKEELALFEKHFGRLDDAFLTRLGDYILKLPVRTPQGM